MQRQITPQSVIKDHSEVVKASHYRSMPGIVVAHYPGKPATVDVQPAVNDVRFDLDTGDRVSEPWPIIPRVPVCYPSGGGYSLTFPLAPGDKVELLADDMDPTVFRLTGNQGDPSDVRRHGGNYWKAIPVDLTDTGAPTAGNTLKIGKGTTTITIDGATINLGGSSDFVALASLVATELGKIQTSLATGSNSGGPVVFATPYVPSSVASALVKSG